MGLRKRLNQNKNRMALRVKNVQNRRAFTRAKAERVISRTLDPEALSSFTFETLVAGKKERVTLDKHPNGHVRYKFAVKLKKLTS
jgi:hypothetical protein